MITFFQWLVVLASGYQVSEALFNNNQLGDKIFNWGGSFLGEQGDGDLYELFCAVVYVLRTGCQWRELPVDFPRWQLVYYYYRVWSEEQIIDELSILDQCLKKLSLPYGKNSHARLEHLS